MFPNWLVFCFYFSLVAVVLMLCLPKSAKSTFSVDIAKLFNYESIRDEAELAGWSLSFKEFTLLLLFTIISTSLIAIFIGNYFFIALGLILCFMLPRTIVLKVKRKVRQTVLFDLPPNLFIFVSKLSYFPNVQTALAQAIPEMSGLTKPVFITASDQLVTGSGDLIDVLNDLAQTTGVRKMDDFADKLVYASNKGFHSRSIESLKETIDDITDDISQIQELEIEAKRKRRELILISLMAWLMPIILSFLNNNNINVFLDTISGQIYIVLFVAATLFCISKGDDYLALNLDKI